MTEQEARALFRELFTAFPNMHDYISRADNPEATLEMWLKMLGNVQLCDAQIVIGRWVSGEVEPPTQWELGMLPHKIRAAATKVSEKRINHENVQRIKQEAARKRGSEYRYDNQGTLMRIAMYAGMLWREGRITHHRFQEIKDYCKSFCATPQVKPEIPADVQELFANRGRTPVTKPVHDETMAEA